MSTIQGFGNWKLPEELIALSKGKTYPKVLDEWSLAYIEDLEKGEESETCLCHHYPIREVCHITNHENGNAAIVGNCCVKRFEGETAFKGNHKIFDALKRIKKNDAASANEELIEYAYSQEILTGKEYDFYMDIWKKRSLTENQESWKVQLNQRIITSISRHNKHSQQVQSIMARTVTDVFQDLKTNPSGIADKRLIELAHEQGVIKDKDEEFYTGLVEKKVRNPSPKQQKWLTDLNGKMIQKLQVEKIGNDSNEGPPTKKRLFQPEKQT